eukprot:1492438-Rhodomonas_salina.1
MHVRAVAEERVWLAPAALARTRRMSEQESPRLGQRQRRARALVYPTEMTAACFYVDVHLTRYSLASRSPRSHPCTQRFLFVVPRDIAHCEPPSSLQHSLLK